MAGSQMGVPVTGIVGQMIGYHAGGHDLVEIIRVFRLAGNEGVTGIEDEAQIRVPKGFGKPFKVFRP